MSVLHRPFVAVLVLCLATSLLVAQRNDGGEERLMSHVEKQRYDGWYNNLAHPDWGAVGKFGNVVCD